MRLCSHFDEYRSYGRHAVIRALGEIDDTEAFGQLSQILLRRNNEFGQAARCLGQTRISDPCPPLLDVLRGTSVYEAESLMLPLAARQCKPAIPVIEEKMAAALGNSPIAKRAPITGAGALCRLGKDYEVSKVSS